MHSSLSHLESEAREKCTWEQGCEEPDHNRLDLPQKPRRSWSRPGLRWRRRSSTFRSCCSALRLCGGRDASRCVPCRRGWRRRLPQTHCAIQRLAQRCEARQVQQSGSSSDPQEAARRAVLRITGDAYCKLSHENLDRRGKCPPKTQVLAHVI